MIAVSGSPTAATSSTDDAETIVQELFFTPEGRSNPYPHYHRLRAAAPVYRSALLRAWLVSGYENGWAVLRDPRFGRNFAREMETRHGPDWRKHSSLTARERSMLTLEGAAHTRLRRLVSKAFTPRTVEALRPSITRAVDLLLDGLADTRGGDFLATVAFPLPVTVIGELLGVPEADRAQFRQLVRDSTAVFEMRPTDADFAAADAAQVTVRRYFEELIAEKRRRPDEGLLSRLARAEDGGDRLSDDELISMASLLFAAGFETTTNLLGNGLLALLHRPDQLARLREDPALFASLPDELLRYDDTAQLALRTAQTTVAIGGETIPEGETVLVLLGAGNHDPARYADPDRLDVTRADVVPLSFGGGVHYCLGAALARAETEIALRSLLERFPTIALAGAARFRERLTLRGVESLPVACGTGRAVAASADVRAESQREAESTTASVTADPSLGRKTGDSLLALRPNGDVTGADFEWRNALRQYVEQENTTMTFPAARAGLELAATSALLARTPLFRSCTPFELAELAATAYPLSFDAGDLICTEGGQALECYAIAEGEAAVSISGRTVGTVGPDDVVGERGPIEGGTRTATVRAATHMITYAISRQRLLALMGRSPAVRVGMLRYIEERYRD
ncbi:MAG: cytochrome P450 [Deltaproteobacteria bacterium]|nr:cytochrome P450 [Deltaproteobacteria bacterium]